MSLVGDVVTFKEVTWLFVLKTLVAKAAEQHTNTRRQAGVHVHAYHNYFHITKEHIERPERSCSAYHSFTHSLAKAVAQHKHS